MRRGDRLVAGLTWCVLLCLLVTGELISMSGVSGAVSRNGCIKKMSPDAMHLKRASLDESCFNGTVPECHILKGPSLDVK